MAGYLGYTVGKLYDWAADHFSSRIALAKGDQRITYREMREKANQLGHALLGMGLRKGDRVGTLFPNSIESALLDYGLAKAGLTQVILHEGIVAPTDNAYMANDSEASVVIYPSRFAPHIEQMRPQLKTVKHFLCVSEGEGIPSHSKDFYQSISSQPITDPPVEVSEDDVVSIYYTGGTTGVPKGCVHASRNRVYTYLTALAEIGLAAPETPSPWNLFMNIPVVDGRRLEFRPPVSEPGDYVTLRAECDCVLVFSACPQDLLPVNAGDPVEAHVRLLG